MQRGWLVAGLLVALAGCRLPAPAPTPVRWTSGPPPLVEENDRFTLGVLELDREGHAKDPHQYSAVLDAASKAQDIFVFIHGWRRDARDLDTMRTFLGIYRSAFDCLSRQDEEGTRSCQALHSYCHPGAPSAKLVVLVLWDAHSGPFGFASVQDQAQHMGRSGFLELLEGLHHALAGRGTLLALGHSLGGAMLASALDEAAAKGPLPVDGALLVVGAFEPAIFKAFKDPATADTGSATLLLNLFNPADGYLRLHRWIYGGDTAGEHGLAGVPALPGRTWSLEGASCQSSHRSALGASMWDVARPMGSPSGAAALMLNLDLTGLVKGHANIENAEAVRLYNRAATELLFRVLWERAFPTSTYSGKAAPSVPAR